MTYSYSDKDCALVTIPQTLVLPPVSIRNIKLISTCTHYQEQIYRTRVSGILNDVNVDNKKTDSANSYFLNGHDSVVMGLPGISTPVM